MPWLRQVWRLGKVRILKSHTDEYYVEWGHGHTFRLPRLRLPNPFAARRRGA
ncbi:MAG: hypothetical protein K0R39_2505 [Symbiobacteriaceae bacterium]|jgi:hypothetical protein|nr:hypothetical protein [Symbiobacteriaceae bacterium]